MIVNLRLILALLLVFVGLTGCHRDDPDDFVPAPRPRVTLTLSLSAPGSISDAGTKAPVPATTAEKKIYNLNIFMFPKSTQPAIQEDKRHYYISGSQLIPDPADNTGTKYLPIELKDVCIGEYDVYIVANNDQGDMCYEPDNHTDPAKCPLNHSDMSNLRASYTEGDGLLMSGKIEGMKVLASQESVDLDLTFNMSKLKISYELATPEAQQLEVYTVTLQNAAVATYPFNPTKPLSPPDDYMKMEIWKGSPLSQYKDEKTLYVTPNDMGRQGITIPAGADPNKYRTAKNAPANATYLYFNCKYHGTILGYTAYLGDDKPDENDKIYFDILPNTIYDVKTIFRAIDPDDERQCSFSFKPNVDKLLFDENSLFVYEGTDTKVTTTTLNRKNGKVAIETNFEIDTKNYFNDRFDLQCAVVPSDGADFRVYIDGSTTPSPNISSKGFTFVLKNTTNEQVCNIKVRVVFEQSMQSTSQELIFRVVNRNGDLQRVATETFNVR